MTEYNGWTNYATWRINLEIFDGLDPEEYFRRKPDDAVLSAWVADYIREAIDPEDKGGLAVDYAMAFASDCNCHEIADHMLADHWQDDDINNDEQARWDDTSAELV